jgi:uncharacterized membrane protein
MENVFTQSLWGDEGFSAILSMKSLPEIIKIIANDTSPPLWNMTEHIAFQLFGTGEVVIRGLASVYFLLTIFFVYKIGALLWSKKTGLLAAALTFLNPFFFIYAFEGRMYSILALGVTASMYFFLKIIYSKSPKLTDYIGYIVATLWAIYSHHFAIFALFIQGLWFLKELATGNLKLVIPMLKAFAAIALGYLPWVIPLYNQTRMVGEGFWLGTPNLEDLRNLIYEYLSQGIKYDHLKIPFTNYALHQFSLYLVLAILAIRKWEKGIKKTLIILTWFLGPILLTWLVSQKFQSIFFNRYLLYAIPAAMLILASSGRKYSGVFIAALILIFIKTDSYYFTHPAKPPFRELAAYVKQTKKPKDFLTNWNSSAHHLWETKYYEIPAPIYVPGGGELPFFVGTALMEESDIVRELPETAVRVGVVTSGPIDEIDLPGYTELEVKEFKNLKFIWYQK